MATDYQWNITSPQHVDGKSLARLFPANFIDEFIAIVRNPIAKLKSAYIFHSIVEGNIQDKKSINQFIKGELVNRYLETGWLDNHFLPQTLFLYPGVPYLIFKLESDGLNCMKAYFEKSILGYNSLILMPHLNESVAHIPFASLSKMTELSDESLELIKQLYQSDFQSFNYE